jgi:hypothetical protein
MTVSFPEPEGPEMTISNGVVFGISNSEVMRVIVPDQSAALQSSAGTANIQKITTRVRRKQRFSVNSVISVEKFFGLSKDLISTTWPVKSGLEIMQKAVK